MHWIYSIYIFVCTSQLAVFLLFITLGLHIKSIDLIKLDPPISYPFIITPYVQAVDDNHTKLSNYVFNNVSGMLFLVPVSVVLDVELCMCSLLSVLFSILFIYISNLDHQRPTLLDIMDDESLMNLAEPMAGRPLEMIRIVFWAFVFIQYLTIFSTINLYTTTIEKYFYAIVKAATVWLLCRTGKKKQTKEMFIILSLFFVYTLWIYSAWFTHGNKYYETLIVLMTETGLDSLLILGHYWDSNAPTSTILNCRSCYVAAACTLVQSLVFVYDGKL
jgi:hypothetical protein